MAIRVRKDVLKLQQQPLNWDPILLWYARAVADMRKRPIAEPTSWRYQAAIHEYDATGDPLRQPGETLPSTAVQRRFWTQCQHNSWYFLSWHRMYLGFFEQIVARTIVDLGGPAGWALPYWNYSDVTNAAARKLPPAFSATATPDGLPNPLRVEDRDAGNDGEIVATTRQTDISRCLVEPAFQAQNFGGNPGFGGPKTRFHHGGDNTVAGKLEATPHGSMHVAVGGWMGGFNTAGLDPLFWLHHANIDRLWAVWRKRNAAHLDPTDASWLTGVRFEFHDATGAVVSMTSSQVVDTKAAPFEYEYEDVSDPIGPGPEAVDMSRRVFMTGRPQPEMVGATAAPVVLQGEPTRARVSINAPTGPAATTEAIGREREVYLNLENITGSVKPTSYAVYVNVPEGENPDQHPELYAGLMAMFGVAEASRADETHSGSGLHYSFEIGHIVRLLESRGAWNPNDVHISFVPEGPPRSQLEGARPAKPSGPISVGRVSVYYA